MEGIPNADRTPPGNYNQPGHVSTNPTELFEVNFFCVKCKLKTNFNFMGYLENILFHCYRLKYLIGAD